MSPYLIKRGVKYSYRRRIPQDLLFCYHTPQIRISLRTNSKRIADRLAGQIDERLDKAFADIRLLKLTWSESRALVAAAVEYSGQSKGEPTLKSMAVEYEQSKGGGWDAKGRQEYWRAYQMFEEAIGDKVVRLIDRSLVIKIREHISATGCSPRTVNKYLQRLSSILRYSVAAGIIQSNPCVEVKYEVPKSEINGNSYKPYSDDEIRWILEEMLQHPGGRRWKSYMYWLPLIGAFSGARSGDICDLVKEDFVQRGEVHCIMMDNHKTGSSARPVPIHSQLVDLGLLEYVDALPKGGKLFDVPRHRANGEYDYKWYMRELRKKIADPCKVFHSWRSTLSTRLNDSGVTATHRADIVGHERRTDTETDKTYTSLTEIRALKEDIEKLSYPVDWTKVKFKGN